MASLVIPEWVVSLVKNIQTVDPKAHVAGGFVRDLDNKVAPKDIDVFVDASSDIEAIQKIVMSGPHTALGETHLDDPKYDAHTGNIASSRMYEDPDGAIIPVNVIQIPELSNDPTDNIKRFDFGICQIAWEPKNGFYATGEYMSDSLKNDFTLVNCVNSSQYWRAKIRFERISPRYPGWHMYVPKRFRSYETF